MQAVGTHLATPTPADLAQVRERVQASGSSFYWAMRFLPQPKSDGLFAIYAFCREVDDIADGDAPAAEKAVALVEWHRRIERLFAGVPDHPITRALAPVLARYGLAQTDFAAVIAGMEMDAPAPLVAPTLATLDLYCDRVASAVGRLCVKVFGEPGAAGVVVADRLGRALQLTNILRDVAEDAAIGRLYLPEELLARAGVLVTTPEDVIRHPYIAHVTGALGAIAMQAFRDAEVALLSCDAQAMRPAVIMMKVYRRTLDKLAGDGWRVRPPAQGLRRVFGRIEKLAFAFYYGLR